MTMMQQPDLKGLIEAMEAALPDDRNPTNKEFKVVLNIQLMMGEILSLMQKEIIMLKDALDEVAGKE